MTEFKEPPPGWYTFGSAVEGWETLYSEELGEDGLPLWETAVPRKPYCARCDYAEHRCGGCGAYLNYGEYVCDECKVWLKAEAGV